MKNAECIRQKSMEHFGFGVAAMKNTRICRNCGKAVSAELSFCETCGSRLPEETVYARYRSMHRSCPTCCTALAQSYRYCPQCGTKQSEQIMKIN